MLCKVSPMDITVIDINQRFSLWGGSTQDIFNEAIGYTGLLSLYTSNYSDAFNVNIYKNNNLEKSYSWSTHTSETITIEISNWDYIKISLVNPSSYNKNGNVTFKGTIPVGIFWLIGKPRELKTIGNKATATIFWIHIDGTRVTQD